MQTIKEIYQNIQERQHLNEAYVNLFKEDSFKKEKYVDDVWEMLQDSYRRMGGIKGSGFRNKQDMIDNIPFWKVIKVKGKVVAAFL